MFGDMKHLKVFNGNHYPESAEACGSVAEAFAEEIFFIMKMIAEVYGSLRKFAAGACYSASECDGVVGRERQGGCRSGRRSGTGWFRRRRGKSHGKTLASAAAAVPALGHPGMFFNK